MYCLLYIILFIYLSFLASYGESSEQDSSSSSEDEFNIAKPKSKRGGESGGTYRHIAVAI